MDSDSGDNELRGLQTGGGKTDKGNSTKMPAVLHTPTRNLRDRSAITRTPKAKAMEEDSEDEAPRPAKRAKKKLQDTSPKKGIAPRPKVAKPKPKADYRETGQPKNTSKKTTAAAVKKAESTSEPQKTVSAEKKSSARKRPRDQSAPTLPAAKKAAKKAKKSPARGVKKPKLGGKGNVEGMEKQVYIHKANGQEHQRALEGLEGKMTTEIHTPKVGNVGDRNGGVVV
ncbi:hypothetical protein BJ165DRAFT_1410466 [Panaeolus papilionaceus]|nr:hypothetical protein BJ165DRAFT_1410466 [Panaeolus papilionaceus]